MKLIRTQDPAALAVIRHDCAHVMAEAVQDLFPGTQVTIGPAIENGFYYDFFRNEPFSTDDLARIEARMAEIVKADLPFVREEVSRDDARARFDAMGERFKLELLDAIPEGEPVTLYHQGNWFDLCRGPHGPSTGRIGAFKLTKVAGSYWRGDAKNAQLQRIYGTAFATKAELDAYLHQLEEAERRDHRKLGREMDLFHVQEEAAGSVFWHPHGWTLWRAVENYVRRRRGRRRLPGGQDAPALRPGVLGALRPLGEVPREHVHAGGRGAPPGAQADELPRPRADLQPAAPQLPRPAAAAGRVRLLPPQRALGCAARHHAGARLHPGRRAHLLHARADHGRERRVLRAA